MACTTLLLSTSSSSMKFFCEDCQSIWRIPSGAYWALAYFIVFNSVVAYAILTWANQFSTGTLVMGYTVLQPVTAALFTLTLLWLDVYPSCTPDVVDELEPCLDPPGWASLCGMVGIMSGLYLIIRTEPSVTSSSMERYEELALQEEIGGIDRDRLIDSAT